MATEDPRTPTLSLVVIRKLLRELLPTDADLETFCIEHFPDVQARFAGEMDRRMREDFLLELSEPAEVLASLYDDSGRERVDASIAMASADERPFVVDPLDLRRDKLELLYSAREQCRLSGEDTADLDVEIDKFTRWRLRASDVLDQRYLLNSLLGRTSFADIWYALDSQTVRTVCIKVYSESPQRRNNIGHFQRVARQLREMQHPYIIRVLDGPRVERGFHYFVMEYLPGGDLYSAVLKKRIDREPALRALLQASEGIEYMHGIGLLHGNVSPLNILLDSLGNAQLAGFDLMRWAGQKVAATPPFPFFDPASRSLPPSDRRADVFGLAMSVIAVLYGQPFPARKTAWRTSIIKQLDCPERVRELLRSATADHPEDRPSTVAQFCSELQNALAGPSETTTLPVRREAAPTRVAVTRAEESATRSPSTSGPKRFAHWLDALDRRAAVGLGLGGGLAVSAPMVWSGHWLGFAGLAGIMGAAAWLTQTGEAVAVPLGPKPARRPEAETAPPLWPQRTELPEHRGHPEDGAITQRRMLSEVAIKLGWYRQWHELLLHTQAPGNKLILLPGERGQGHFYFMMRIQMSFPTDPPRSIVSLSWARKPVPSTRRDMLDSFASALGCSSELPELRGELYRRLMGQNLIILHPIVWDDSESVALRRYYIEWLPELLDPISAPFSVKIIQPIDWHAASAKAKIAAMLIGWLFHDPPLWVRRVSEARRGRALISELGRRQSECLPVCVLTDLEPIKPKDVRDFSRMLKIPESGREEFADEVFSGARNTDDVIENLINYLSNYKRS